METVGQQVREALTYFVLLGHAGERRPAWVIVVWWLIVGLILGAVYLGRHGVTWAVFWPLLLPAPSTWLWLTKRSALSSGGAG